MTEAVSVYSDGACSGNPGPGSWAYVVIDSSDSVILEQKSGSEAHTTNNRMELLAVIKALESKAVTTVGPQSITVYTDSQYVQKGISNWIIKWKANGWRTASKGVVKNQDLWRRLDAVIEQLTIEWRWIKGHAGDQYNELCDKLARQAVADEALRLASHADKPV